MKLNFWQWLGLILLILGTVLWVYNRDDTPALSPPASPSATQPAS